MDEALLANIKRDLLLSVNPPRWFRAIVAAMLRIEALFGGSLMRHGLGPRAKTHSRRILAAVDSMTMAERLDPELIDYRRIERISRGSGVPIFDAQLAAHHLVFQQKWAERNKDKG